MLGFISRLCKIQVVRHGMVLVGGGKHNLHIEFTPSLLCDPERRVFKSCMAGGDQHSHHLIVQGKGMGIKNKINIL